MFGSIFLPDIHTQSKPINGLNNITNNEFEVLLTTLGSMCNPSRLKDRLFSANNANDPPLCSKKAQKTIENTIKINAAINFFLEAGLAILNIS